MEQAGIVHMDLDTFFVSVERILDPTLKNKPVIVGGNPYGRGVVAGCSYEARAYGVHSAQPIRRAFRLCPNAVFLHGNFVEYAEYSKTVREILTDIAPICEASSIDEFYLDLRYTERLKGDTYRWAQEIQRSVSGETGLPLSSGTASNKLIAKVATTQVAKKGAIRHHRVETGQEAPFLAPFEIRAMPGIGEKTEEKLRRIGIEHIGDLAQTSVRILSRFFGKTGRNLHEKAHGIDYSPVIPSRDQKSYSREQTYMEDTIDVQTLFTTLLDLSSRLASDLRADNFFAGKITLKLRYSDMETVTKTASCSWTNQDQTIFRIVEKLFKALYTRRIKVRLLGIEASELLPDLAQHYLFSEAKDFGTLYPTLDRLRLKYENKKLIGFASVIAS
jgi:DNA polymerase-4